jgi:hypothetical protein
VESVASGLDYFWIYDLRHTFCQRHYRSGNDLAGPTNSAMVSHCAAPVLLVLMINAIGMDVHTATISGGGSGFERKSGDGSHTRNESRNYS